MKNQNIVTGLILVLSDTYALYVKTQSYHWNVEGPMFKILHLMFEEQYRDLAEAIDTIAEHIRGLEEKVPATFEEYKKFTIIQDGNPKASSTEMLRDLYQDQLVISRSLRNLLKDAQKYSDDVIMDYTVDRLRYHRKIAWMLKSTLAE